MVCDLKDRAQKATLETEIWNRGLENQGSAVIVEKLNLPNHYEDIFIFKNYKTWEEKLVFS